MAETAKGNVTPEEYQALIFYAVGFSSESRTKSHTLAFCGSIHRDGSMHPVANSGYSIGTLQTDLGQHPEAAQDMVHAYQTWTKNEHPDWHLDVKQANALTQHLSQTGNKMVEHNAHDIKSGLKSHLNTFLHSDAGMNFIHQRDTAQIEKLQNHVYEPLQGTPLYKQLSHDDQLKLLTTVSKVYNQSESRGEDILENIQDGTYKSLKDVENNVAHAASYIRTGVRDAMSGEKVFEKLSHSKPESPEHVAWQAILQNPLQNPNSYGDDPANPRAAVQRKAIEEMFIHPGRAYHEQPQVGGHTKAHSMPGKFASDPIETLWATYWQHGHSTTGLSAIKNLSDKIQHACPRLDAQENTNATAYLAAKAQQGKLPVEAISRVEYEQPSQGKELLHAVSDVLGKFVSADVAKAIATPAEQTLTNMQQQPEPTQQHRHAMAV